MPSTCAGDAVAADSANTVLEKPSRPSCALTKAGVRQQTQTSLRPASRLVSARRPVPSPRRLTSSLNLDPRLSTCGHRQSEQAIILIARSPGQQPRQRKFVYAHENGCFELADHAVTISPGGTHALSQSHFFWVDTMLKQLVNCFEPLKSKQHHACENSIPLIRMPSNAPNRILLGSTKKAPIGRDNNTNRRKKLTKRGQSAHSQVRLSLSSISV